MTQSMIGYDPRASLFKKKKARGFSFYINYYLPNGVRVRRLCGPTREVSLRRMRIKERELLDDARDSPAQDDDEGKMDNQMDAGTRETMNNYLSISI